jgi:3-oxoacyl-[acyl-carrier-protein] synthase-3
MPFTNVYITRTANFLPNKPVLNDEMEDYLGLINDKPSKARKIVLRNNGIKRRYYAIDKNGKATHTNAEMTALAVRSLFSDDPGGLQSIELLSCGTSSPDQMMPSHGVMVHGFLPESGAIEVVSPSGVCCASMHALKYAYMAVKTGDVQKAVATGSERFSRSLRSDVFEDEVKKLAELEQNPYIGFEKDFLRWMLSDGAGAFCSPMKKTKPASAFVLTGWRGFLMPMKRIPVCTWPVKSWKMARLKLHGLLSRGNHFAVGFEHQTGCKTFERKYRSTGRTEAAVNYVKERTEVG